VSELATNILKHGREGSIAFSVITDPTKGLGIRLVADDHGPPIETLSTAFIDGNTSAGPIDPLDLWRRRGIGAGLGAISRLGDQVGYSRLAQGNRFEVLRFARARRAQDRN